MISLNTNISDLILQRTLFDATLGLNNAIERMTTGFKVNHAKDNAANYSIIEDLNTRISSMLQVQNNTEEGISLLQTAEGGLEEISGLMERLRDLAMQASTDTHDAGSREIMQTEADAIKKEINRIIRNVEYDGQNLYYNSELESILDTVYSIFEQAPNHLAIPTTRREAPPDPNIPNSYIISDTIVFSGGETREIDIDGMKYVIKNKSSSISNTFIYSKDLNTGVLTIESERFSIQSHSTNTNNIVLNGDSNDIYFGDSNDKIVINGDYNNVDVGNGNDEIVSNTFYAAIFSGNGDDRITFNLQDTIPAPPQVICQDSGGNDTYVFENAISGVAFRINDSDGDNKFHINSSGITVNTIQSPPLSSQLANTFYIIGSNNIILSDTNSMFVLEGNNNYIATTATSYYANGVNATGNTILNAQIAPEYTLLENLNKTVTLYGAEYNFATTGPNSKLAYYYNPFTNSIGISSYGYHITEGGGSTTTETVLHAAKTYYIRNYTQNDFTLLEGSYATTIESHRQQGGNINLLSKNELHHDIQLDIARIGAYVDSINVYGLGYGITLTEATVGNLNLFSDLNTIKTTAGGKINNTNIYGTKNTFTIADNSGDQTINIYGDQNTIEENVVGNRTIVNVNSNLNEVFLNDDGSSVDRCSVNGHNNNIAMKSTDGDVNIAGNNNTVSVAYLKNENIGINIVGYDNIINSVITCAHLDILGGRNKFLSDSDLSTVYVEGDENHIELGPDHAQPTQANIIGNENYYSCKAGINATNIVGDNNHIGGTGSFKVSGNTNSFSGNSNNSDIYEIISGNDNIVDDLSVDNILIDHGINTDLTSANVIDATEIDFETDFKVGIGNDFGCLIHQKIGYNTFSLSIDLSSADAARSSLLSIDEHMNKLNEQLLNIGTSINRLEMVIDEQNIKIENMVSSRSTLRDADIAEESSAYIRNQILQQASATLLATSRNIRYENVIGLLQGLRR